MGDRAEVIAEVPAVGALDVRVDPLELDEDEREAIDEADEIGAAQGGLPLDPELLGEEEVVRLRVVPVDDADAALRLAVVVVAGRAGADDEAVLEEGVELAVGLDEAHGRAVAGELVHGLVERLGRDSRVELREGRAEAAPEDDLAPVLAAEGAAVAVGLLVHVRRGPAHRREELHGGLLDVVVQCGQQHPDDCRMIRRGCA